MTLFGYQPDPASANLGSNTQYGHMGLQSRGSNESHDEQGVRPVATSGLGNSNSQANDEADETNSHISARFVKALFNTNQAKNETPSFKNSKSRDSSFRMIDRVLADRRKTAAADALVTFSPEMSRGNDVSEKSKYEGLRSRSNISPYVMPHETPQGRLSALSEVSGIEPGQITAKIAFADYATK